LGFAGKAAESRTRLLNRDGSFNVRRRGLPFSSWFSAYHYLIQIPWWKFDLFLFGGYVVINLIFGLIYVAIGTQGLAGIDGVSLSERYLQSVFFSTQTFTTVGFGRIAPVGTAANVTSALESLTGLLSFAFATGLLYGRFSRPVARIIFSRHALVSPYQDISAFMFRVANQRSNQLIDIEAVLTLVRLEDDGAGHRVRRFYELELERQHLSFFHLSWTVVHPIDANSPLFGVTKEQLDYSDAEFLIILKAFDDTFSQTVHTRMSYKHKEVIFGRKFRGIIRTDEEGMTEIDLGKIHDHEDAHRMSS
jgi:inward rectifier potassium channel